MLFQQKFLFLFKKTIYRGIDLKIKKKFIKNYFNREWHSLDDNTSAEIALFKLQKVHFIIGLAGIPARSITLENH